MTKTAVYPGSFDPIHLGHVDITQRSASLFDRVIVAVYNRPNKRLMFTSEQRVALAREALQDFPNVEVCLYGDLTVAFARQIGASVLVRGLRVISDFELEYQMALTNNQLDPNIETVCLMTHKDYAFLTSSIVKEITLLGGDASALVPPNVASALRALRESLPDPVDFTPGVSVRD
ncbi:MAG: pantetheine-phosphate adenylyltransferase [Anaerolineae bacterium]|nr:pantetheine-phosphate adenylyltransferase [Anaerolineae bacterium]